MSKRSYVPHRGDIVWLQFNPQAGHEQAGHRPALVLSPASYNRPSGLMLYCPMTSQRKGYPFEVVIAADTDRESAVLADQVKSLDWKVSKTVKKGTASIDVIVETLSKHLQHVRDRGHCGSVGTEAPLHEARSLRYHHRVSPQESPGQHS